MKKLLILLLIPIFLGCSSSDSSDSITETSTDTSTETDSTEIVEVTSPPDWIQGAYTYDSGFGEAGVYFSDDTYYVMVDTVIPAGIVSVSALTGQTISQTASDTVFILTPVELTDYEYDDEGNETEIVTNVTYTFTYVSDSEIEMVTTDIDTDESETQNLTLNSDLTL